MSDSEKAPRAMVGLQVYMGSVALCVRHQRGEPFVLLSVAGTGTGDGAVTVLLSISMALELHRALGVEIDSTGSAR